MSKITAQIVADELTKIQKKNQTFQDLQRYPSTDVRQKVFEAFGGTIKSTVLVECLLISFEKGMWDSEKSMNYLGFDVNHTDAQKLIEIFAKHTKLSFVTMFNFQLEVFLKTILSILDSDKTSDGFYTVINNVLEKAKLEDQDKKFQILYTLAAIRNSLHSGGVHTKDDIENYTIQDQVFEFLKGKAVNCASWLHICVACDGILDIVNEIIESDKVTKITENVDYHTER